MKYRRLVALVLPCSENLSQPLVVLVLALDSHSANLSTFNQSASWLTKCFYPHLKSSPCRLLSVFYVSPSCEPFPVQTDTHTHTPFFLSLLAWYCTIVSFHLSSLSGCRSSEVQSKTTLVAVQEAFLFFSTSTESQYECAVVVWPNDG